MKYLLIAALLFACTMEPKYNTPPLSIPLEKTESNIHNIKWNTFMQTPALHSVIKTALKNNQDLKTAYLNINLARTTFNLRHGNLFPTAYANASVTKQQAPVPFNLFMPNEMYHANAISFTAYELDFFGRLRSLKKSAFEQYLATEEAKNITRITLITDTANTYIQLLADQKILHLTKDAMKEQEKKVNILKERRKYGSIFQIDVILAETEYENIKVLFNNYTKAVELDKNALMLLMGVFDEKLIPQSSFEEIAFNEKLLEFMPSKTLLARPDIKQAEHNLRAANANIGAARAAFFPSLQLTGNYGYFSRTADALLKSDSWSIMPQINLPIFDGGKNRGNLRLTKTQKEILISQYQKAIQTAFKEVLDELTKRKANIEQMKAYNNIVALNEKSDEIIKERYLHGTIDAIVATNSALQLVTSKQNAVTQQMEHLQNLVMIYKVLGGGGNVLNEQTQKEDTKDAWWKWWKSA